MYHSFCKPAFIVDYRTPYSGVRRRDLQGAPSVKEVQDQVAELLEGKTVVGHTIHKDLAVLRACDVADEVIDVSKYSVFKTEVRQLIHIAGRSRGILQLCPLPGTVLKDAMSACTSLLSSWHCTNPNKKAVLQLATCIGGLQQLDTLYAAVLPWPY